MGAVKSRGLLKPPERLDNIPKHAQWLGGVGAGSWFALYHDATMGKYQYRVQRFGPDGTVECDAMYFLADDFIDITKPYKFTYISHCEMCTILQEGIEYIIEVIHESVA